jgi:hypothetical protein
MPKISLSVPHQLGQEEARQRISRLIAETRAQASGQVSDVAETWTGYVDTFSFRARGFSVAGRLEVQAAQIRVDINLPFTALPFKSRIERELLAHARQLLA